MTLNEAINLMNTVYKDMPRIPLKSTKHPFTLEQLLAEGRPLDGIAEIMLAPDETEAMSRYSFRQHLFKGGI